MGRSEKEAAERSERRGFGRRGKAEEDGPEHEHDQREDRQESREQHVDHLPEWDVPFFQREGRSKRRVSRDPEDDVHDVKEHEGESGKERRGVQPGYRGARDEAVEDQKSAGRDEEPRSPPPR